MAKESCENPIVDIPSYFGIVSFLIALVLLILGFRMYQTEHPKELHYKEDMCLVLTTGHRNTTCQTRQHKYQCFGAVWNVRLENEFVSVKTTIEGERKYRSLNVTLANAVEYQVSLGLNQASLHVLYGVTTVPIEIVRIVLK